MQSNSLHERGGRILEKNTQLLRSKMLPTIYTKKECAEYLKVSPRFIQKAVSLGKIGFFRVGKKDLRFTETHIIKFMEKGK